MLIRKEHPPAIDPALDNVLGQTRGSVSTSHSGTIVVPTFAIHDRK
jgi:hypothetical protein